MVDEDRIDIDTFKMISKAITESEDIDSMINSFTQLLVGSLGIKGCTIFALNPETEELEILGSSGLSLNYLNKGPILVSKSIEQDLRGRPIIISDVEKSNRVQYPEDARSEGIRSIISLPVMIHGKFIGDLRLYHYEEWHISDRDVDSLLLLGEKIGLALMYKRLLNALRAIKETVTEVHSVWLAA